MAIRTGSSTDRGTPALGALFLNTETRKIEVGDGFGWWGTDLREITSLAGRGEEAFITKGDDSHAHKVTDDFELGTEYTIMFEATDRKVRYWFNGELVPFTVSSSASTRYFKAGDYLQSNPDSAPSESTGEFSEVEILALKVAHS